MKPEFFIHFLTSTVPSDVYYSSAYYDAPDREMRKKGWIGADLVFDIDSDHLPTPCRGDHRFWNCESCDNAGVGQPPVTCPSCNNQKFKEIPWLCETCLEAAKAETLKLIEFLTNDFGFFPEDIHIFFSGQRGYHIHLEIEEIKLLDQGSRREIADYIMGTGLKANLHGLMEVGKGKRREIVGPDLKDPGWQGRIARGVYDILVSPHQILDEVEGISRNAMNIIEAQKDSILNAWKTGRPWGVVKGLGLKTWENLTELGKKKQAASIDTVVTTDIHRLIRLPFTLHGKTGLKVVKIPYEALEMFDPLNDAVVFKDGVVTVYVREAHRFRLGRTNYGPYKDEEIKLPTAAALYLFCKNAAFLLV